ncbi:MAG: sarcosine oxidase subunit delta [Deltaproteobacteria bacterium]|nr:sarcosine oxidase subunit delta [Deltaproteobacteria bacterium]
MSFLITCPNCGSRPVHEFRFGAEERGGKQWGDHIDPISRYEMVYNRCNVAGPQKELWFHRDGCETWVSITRDTRRDIEIADVEKRK